MSDTIKILMDPVDLKNLIHDSVELKMLIEHIDDPFTNDNGAELDYQTKKELKSILDHNGYSVITTDPEFGFHRETEGKMNDYKSRIYAEILGD